MYDGGVAVRQFFDVLVIFIKFSDVRRLIRSGD